MSPLKIGQSRVVWWEMVKGYRLQLTSTQLGVCAVGWGDNRGSTTHTLWLILVSISQLLLGSVGLGLYDNADLAWGTEGPR